MNIGENIRRIRTEKGITQRELGEKLGGISQQQIGQWENGYKRPKLETVIKIADALGVPSSELIDVTALMGFGQDALQVELEGLKFGVVTNNVAQFFKNQEWKLLEHYYKLNSEGKAKAIDRVEELTEIPRYIQPEANPNKADDTQ